MSCLNCSPCYALAEENCPFCRCKVVFSTCKECSCESGTCQTCSRTIGRISTFNASLAEKSIDARRRAGKSQEISSLYEYFTGEAAFLEASLSNW